MALRNLTCGIFQIAQRATGPRMFSMMPYQKLFVHQPIRAIPRCLPSRTFSSVQTNDDAYRDLSTFLDKEINLEKSAQKHPSKLPKIEGFEVQANGPEVTLTRQTGNEKTIVKFNVTNTVNANESDHADETDGPLHQQQGGESSAAAAAAAVQPSSQLKSRPTFTVDLNRGGQTLSFLCSYLPDEYPETRHLQGSETEPTGSENENEPVMEDFQIDEFAIHDGEWKETVYSADCSVIDGELYDKLLNVLEEQGIGEEFANQLADFSTAHEHRQYIGLLEKLQQFVKK